MPDRLALPDPVTQPGPVASRPWPARVRDSRWGSVVVLAVTAVAVIAGAWLVNRPAGGGLTAVPLQVAASGEVPTIGRVAPDLIAATDIDGAPVTLAALRGRPVWLTFGASWCAPCRAEAPDLEQAHRAGLAVVAVYMTEDAASVRAFAGRLGLTYTQVPDVDTRLAASYRVMGVPTHYLLDRDGVLRSVQAGAVPPERIRELVAALG